jgi:O-antigen ligase
LLGLAIFYAGGSAWGITRVDTLRGFPAIQGLAYEHDIYGSTCAAGALAFIVLWREKSALLSRRAGIAGVWLCLAGLVLSLSRGAWIGFLAGLGLLLFTTPRARRSLMAFAVAGGLALIVIGLGAWYFGPSTELAGVGSSTAATVGAQAAQSLNFTTSTGARRITEWKGALREVVASPILGLGTNSWGQRHFESTLQGPIPAFLGNWLIRTLYDSGAVGVVLLLWFLWFVAWPGKAVRDAREGTGDSPSIARAFVFASAGLLVCYLATDALLLIWPWLLFGLARSARRIVTSEP